MKNLFLLILCVSLILAPASIRADVVDVNQPVLTEREAAMIAYNHYMDNDAGVLLPELKVRVTEVREHDGVYSVTVSLVSKIDGSFVRNAAQYDIDGTQGRILASYKIRSTAVSVDEVLARIESDRLTPAELAEMTDQVLSREHDLTESVLRDLAEHCGDSLDRIVRLVHTVDAHLPAKSAALRDLADRVAEAAYGQAVGGMLEIDRETMRLLDQLRQV